MISAEQVRSSLLLEYQRYVEKDRLDDALLFLTLAGELKDPETAASAFRWATTKERRGEELLEEASKGEGKVAAERRGAGRKLLEEAADVYMRHAVLTTMDETASGNSLWRAAQLYDQAGNADRSIAAYERFSVQRGRDSRVAEALLAMGRLYQARGEVGKAIPLYERNIKENPRTGAMYLSVVNLARCYMAIGATPGKGAKDENFEKAEKVLLSLVQDNPDLKPMAEEFRVSVFTLGELYYRTERWAEAILRLEEAMERYPDSKDMPRVMFMLAESYRRSAGEVGDALAKDAAIERRDELMKARRDRLERAAALFTRLIGVLDVEPAEALAGREPVLTAVEEDYLRSSYLDRADCYFELGDYATAVKLYDQTATRFSQRLAAVQAYVQIVNSYLMMQQPTQAGAAAERAQWVLKRIPDEEFGHGTLALSRQYYEDLLKLGKRQ